MPVVLTDQYGGTDAAKVDRQIQFLQNSHSLTSLMCSAEFNFNLTTSGTNNYVLSFATIISTDDFVSMSAQFNTFRVRSIRFDVYDIAPQTTGVAVFSTFHADGGSIPADFNSITDRPDSQIVAPGTGKISLTWVAKGSTEQEFQGVASFTDFGGLSAFAQNVGTAAAKYSIIMKAVVDFRGRS